MLKKAILDAMEKDRLKNLARDKRFIPVIYNYCDRWCERCPQTSRCLNFAISEEDFADPETRDINNEAFWKKLSVVFTKTLEFLKEEAEEHGIDLEALDTVGLVEESKEKNETVESHEVCRMASLYSDLVADWFKSDSSLFSAAPALSEEDTALEEALEVIRWYQHFIYVKLRRAVRGELNERQEEANEFPKDSDGTAKIALIGIDRSIGAWGMVYAHDLLYDEKTLRLIACLDCLREEVQNAFPGARSFIRLGFDTIDLNS